MASSPSFQVFKGSKGGKIITGNTTKSLDANKVLLRVTHSGLCGTDMHYKEVDMALGHEGVGIVEEVGSSVTLFKKGDRAGWGYNHHCCGHCKPCLSGDDVFCPERAMYGVKDLDQGSMATHAVWEEGFLFHIPENLESKYAAPLQCGGVTVYNALMRYPVKAGDRVGIIGVGGLGHLAIQFANKMGCEVLVFSGSDSKKDQAMELGAHEFYATKGLKELKLKGDRGLDRLIITTSAKISLEMYMAVMNPNGSIYPISVDEGSLEVPYMPLLLSGLRIQGNIVGSRQTHKEMLQFAAVQGVKPVIETFPMTVEGIEEGFKKLSDGKMRFRGVFVAN